MNFQSVNLRSLGAGAVIFAVTLLAYLPAVRGGFLWDDDGHVTREDLRSPVGLERIWFEMGATQQYYPLLHTAFWVEHRMWGNAVVGYHLTNILLHATAACLVMMVVRRLFETEGSRLTGRRAGLPPPRGAFSSRAAVAGGGQGPAAGGEWPAAGGVAWLAGLIFALHPVCVESVAWISEQKNTLSTVFYLGSALVYLGFDRDRSTRRYGLALGLFVLALLTKTVTATLPAALLIVFWWKRGRLDWRRDVWPLLPWFGLGAAAGLGSTWVERVLIGARGADFALPFLSRCLLAGRVIWFYFGKLVWPADLMFIYPRWTVDGTVWWQYLYPLGTLLLLAGLVLLARRRRGPLALAAAAGLGGFLIFAGTLFPVMGFVNVYPFIFSYVADHFQYQACLGIIVPMAAGLALAARRLPPAIRPLAPVGSAGLLAFLGALTWIHSGTFRDGQTLYRDTLARNPACAMAHNNLGLILSQIPGRMPEAIDHYKAALRIDPRFSEAHLNLGYALAKTPGRLSEAIAADEAAVRVFPDLADAHNNLGLALSQVSGRTPEAVEQFEVAVRLRPGSAEMQDNLGKALLQVPGRLPEAITHLEAAVRLDPDSADRHGGLGSALLKIPERFPEAITEFEAVVRIRPESFEAHFVLGMLLSGLPDRRPEALAHFETVLRIKPDFEPAREWIERLRTAPR